jgi:hypothetical protein
MLCLFIHKNISGLYVRGDGRNRVCFHMDRCTRNIMPVSINGRISVDGFNNESLMLTRIICRAKSTEQGKCSELQKVKPSFAECLKVFNIDRGKKFRFLCGSI